MSFDLKEKIILVKLSSRKKNTQFPPYSMIDRFHFRCYQKVS